MPKVEHFFALHRSKLTHLGLPLSGIAAGVARRHAHFANVARMSPRRRSRVRRARRKIDEIVDRGGQAFFAGRFDFGRGSAKTRPIQ